MEELLTMAHLTQEIPCDFQLNEQSRIRIRVRKSARLLAPALDKILWRRSFLRFFGQHLDGTGCGGYLRVHLIEPSSLLNWRRAKSGVPFCDGKLNDYVVSGKNSKIAPV